MADNVTLNSGTGGAVLSTDEVTRATVVQHVQYVKLMNGTDAAVDVIPGEATNGLDVDVTRVQGTVTVDGSGVTQPVSHGALTELAAAINASSQVDVNIAASGATVPVSGTVTANLAAGTNNIGDVDVLSIAAGDNNIGNVDIVTMPNVTLAAGTNTNEVVGDAAHDAAVAGNPVRIGGRAVSADYTSVATGDTADLITTLGGKLVTHPYAIPENYVSGATSDMTGTTSTSVVAAAGAGLRNYITHILVQNSHATVGTWVNIQDGSGGTTLYTVYAAAVGGGASITLPCPIKTTANTALFCANVTTGANTRVSASGYKAP